MIDRWRALAHRHFGLANANKCVFVSEENPDLRAWLVDLSVDYSVDHSSWAMPFMIEPFRKWHMYRSVDPSSSESWLPKLWVLCDKGDSKKTFSFVKSRFLPLMHDVVTALIKEGVASAHSFQDSEVVFVAIRKPLRSLPARHGSSVNPENINGGLTHRSRVLVYRVEDAGKVLVHELIHLAGLDAALQTVDEEQERIAKRYRVQTLSRPLGLNESYTEVMACYLHALWWAAKESEFAVGSMRIKTENEALKRIALHIQSVARRVWKHFHHRRGTVEWKEKTHCFSYVACRAALWTPMFFRRFLHMYPPGKRPLDSTEYTNLLIEAMDDWISKNKRFITRPPTSMSLKMTCFA